MSKSMIATLTLAMAVASFSIFTFGQQTPAAAASAAPASKTPATAAKPKTAPAAKSAASLALKTRKEKFSYALGMNMGMNLGASLKKQSVAFDPALVARGLRDTLAGSKPALTDDEARSVLMAVQAEVRQKQQEATKAEQAKIQAEGAVNKKAGDEFLAANKAKEGVVVLPSGLQYKILQAGTGPKPAATDSVVCNYRGTLINGTEFDNSEKHGGPATFPVSGVIKGWTEALQQMPVGSKWQLVVPADLAYGDQGMGGDIPPSSTLVFEVELVKIVDKDKPAEEKK